LAKTERVVGLVVFTVDGNGFRVRADVSLREREQAVALCHILQAFEASVDRFPRGKARGERSPVRKVRMPK